MWLKLGVWVVTAAIAAIAMEPWAALLHGKVWHRWLYRVHRSHHEPRRGRFEANDALSGVHAPIAIALILFGCRGTPGLAREIAFGFGLGMTLFGVAYVVVHDGLVHGRLGVGFLARSRALRRIRGAHLVHHGPGEGVPYGLFLGPAELARARRARLDGALTHAGVPAPSRAPSDRGREDRAPA